MVHLSHKGILAEGNDQFSVSLVTNLVRVSNLSASGEIFPYCHPEIAELKPPRLIGCPLGFPTSREASKLSI